MALREKSTEGEEAGHHAQTSKQLPHCTKDAKPCMQAEIDK